MYKFISISEYEAAEKENHPDARVSEASNEVVISCNDGTGTHTWEEAKSHIETYWDEDSATDYS